MLPESLRFRRSDEEVAILSECTQTFFLPDVSLTHFALDCSDGTQAIFRFFLAVAFVKRKENSDVALTNRIPDVLSADSPRQLPSELSHGKE
jgi:hypothetical protein